MTSHMFKKMIRASATSVSDELYVSASHPQDCEGVLIQSELSAEEKRRIGHPGRFHCRNIPAEEIPALINGLQKALKHSRLIRKKYFGDREKRLGGK